MRFLHFPGVHYLCLLSIMITHMANANENSADGIISGKPVIYQMFTRLFGNTKTFNKPWGTIEENGVGKFNDINDAALEGIRELGATHVWYTGVLHHAVIRDYTQYGISNDDPDVVKGRAGSPYAVKDYYNVDPDLAVDPAKRMEEFQALIMRTHKHGLKVIIDIVPNHVARQYHSLKNSVGSEGQEDFGARDDRSVEYKRDNNFYYVVGQNFKVPAFSKLPGLHVYKPLGGEGHPLSDGLFEEKPAKWTGNGSRKAQPQADDWYETVKINYGIKPNGEKDFSQLPARYAQKSIQDHATFWQNKDVPDTWKKFRAIAEFWLAQGVDGFRFDMAEMVPVEFWSYLNSSIKIKNPNAFLLAEVYDPAEYRNYIHLGKMDYLYDKVEMYDTLKSIIQKRASTDSIATIQNNMADIEEHMLHFLENHDEQRIASPEFAGNPLLAKPAMVLSATISRSPTMIYFGQEVGEPAAQDAGFGKSSRTTIFDYWGVPKHQRWVNGGKYDGGKLSRGEKSLRKFYSDILNFSASSPAMQGAYKEIHTLNRNNTPGYGDTLFSFARWQTTGDQQQAQKILVISNFSSVQQHSIKLKIPGSLITSWKLADGQYEFSDAMNSGMKSPYGENSSTKAKGRSFTMHVKNGSGELPLKIEPLQSLVLELSNNKN